MKAKLFLLLLSLTIMFCAGTVCGQKIVSQKEVETDLKAETINEVILPNSPDKNGTTSAEQTPPNNYVRPDSKARFKRYVKSVVGPTSIATNVASAGFYTWTDTPEEWGPTWEGFGRRVASNLGKSAIKNTTIYALDESFKLDSRFYRSEKKDFGSRLKNALLSTVTARKPNGKRVFGFPRVIGTYTSNIVAAETWYPERYDYKDGLRSGTISLGTNALFNVVKEFVFK